MSRTAEKILKEIETERQELVWGAGLTLLTFVGLLAGIIFQVGDFPTWYSVTAFIIAYLAGGVPATIEAIATLRDKALDINVLMILAALAAAGVGEARDGAILLFLFSLAGTLEGYAMGNTKRAVAGLLSLRPDQANLLLADGTTKKVVTEELQLNDQVIVRPGERMPVDGEVVIGIGAVDQSPVTGESVPVDKTPGDMVYAGSVNKNAVLTVKVTKLAHQSTLARMIDLVTEAQAKRSPSERFSDWFGQRYTIVVLVGSAVGLGIFILVGIPYAEAFYKAATLLVVASPCAIVISVPASVLSALAVSARSGVLFKGGASLEDFGNISVLALDKTGTLTEGKMQVTNLIPFTGSAEMLLAIAAGLESHSDHPLARCILAKAVAENQRPMPMNYLLALPGKGVAGEVNGVKYFAGNKKLCLERGVDITSTIDTTLTKLEAEGKTTVIIAGNQQVIGLIALADTIRPSALSALNKLKYLGVKKLVMLSGDTNTVAKAIGQQLGLEPQNIYGDLLPEDKVAIIEQLTKTGPVAFVGDGVNDAGALAIAQVGVAMGVAGTDVALETADVALLSDDLEKLAYAFRLSKRANAIIKQNLFFAVGIMALMVVVTVFWYLPLPLGVIGHEGGTLLVVANGLRLLLMSK